MQQEQYEQQQNIKFHQNSLKMSTFSFYYGI